MDSQKSSSKAETIYLLIGYGVVICLLIAKIAAGGGTRFTWSVLIVGGYSFLRAIDRLRR